MMKKLLFGLCCLAVTHMTMATDAAPTAETPAQMCTKGPITKTFGASDWLVYGCEDGKTLTMISAPGNPASPFVFILYPNGGGYQLHGEGTGSKAYTDAAEKELSSLSVGAIQALLVETRALSPQTVSDQPPCKDTLPITVENFSGTQSDVNGSRAETTRYYDDGSFSGKIMEQGKITWLFSGTWKLNGHTVNYVYTFSSLDRIPVGTTDTDEILEIGCGGIIYRNNSGIVRREKLDKP